MKWNLIVLFWKAWQTKWEPIADYPNHSITKGIEWELTCGIRFGKWRGSTEGDAKCWSPADCNHLLIAASAASPPVYEPGKFPPLRSYCDALLGCWTWPPMVKQTLETYKNEDVQQQNSLSIHNILSANRMPLQTKILWFSQKKDLRLLQKTHHTWKSIQ